MTNPLSSKILASKILASKILALKTLVIAITIPLIGGISIQHGNAQPTSPASETTPSQPTLEKLPQSNYLGLGGVIGIQGNTTSLSQGTFSVLSKNVLTDNLSVHTASTVFGSLTSSSSIALTYNQPMNSDSLPVSLTPFLGGGITAYYDNSTKIIPHITAGLDLGLPTNLTGTVRANANFVTDRQTEIGILFGIGYNY
jgi:hypothetical protein